MNVSLTAELEKFIEKKVKSGRYQSASEVVRDALRLLEDEDHLREVRLKEVREKVQLGLAQLDRGEGIPGEAVFEEMKRKSAGLRRTKK